MTRTKLLRRIAILCCHFLRNLAFYRGGRQNGELILKDPFWVNVNGNFLDICVLEWCKLFGERRGKHHWRKVITDQPAFFTGMLRAIKLTEGEFEIYINEVKSYRDKFVAHLDADEIMHPPKLELARKSVAFLYDYLRTNEEMNGSLNDAPTNASRFYHEFALQGKRAYLSVKTRDLS